MSDGFMFEGRQQTARKLAKQYPALSEGRWQTVLERGCKTWPEARDEAARLDNARDAARVLAGRKAAKSPHSRITVMRRSKEWA